MKRYKYYVVYQITDLTNGYIYIGQHQTDDLDDGYLGSGSCIKEAIRRNGRKSFKKDILFIFDNFEDMNAKEAELVNEEFIARKDTYNLIVGGQQDDYEARKLGALVANQKKLENGTFHNNFMASWSPETRKCALERRNETIRRKIATGEIHCDKSFLGKHHTEEAKRRIGSANSKHQKGAGNSQFGKHWYMNPETKESHLLKDDNVPNGWTRGRFFIGPVE